ncbi:YkgJ family cysteine cluster protein [Candidatus Woesearchaeota archaeon]|nr:YkgJ family cysteine cluster protein [Candidatus Woesearchaeota archaeon]
MLTKQNFTCNRSCAECCKHLIVKLSKKDIGAIEKKGHKKSSFVEFDDIIKNPVLKRAEKGCLFLSKRKGMYFCTIYDIRPEVCRLYPFVDSEEVESCRPDLFRYKHVKS